MNDDVILQRQGKRCFACRVAAARQGKKSPRRRFRSERRHKRGFVGALAAARQDKRALGGGFASERRRKKGSGASVACECSVNGM